MILNPAGSSQKAIATVFDEIAREKIVAGEEIDVGQVREKGGML